MSAVASKQNGKNGIKVVKNIEDNGKFSAEGLPAPLFYLGIISLSGVSLYIVQCLFSTAMIVATSSVAITYIVMRYGCEIYKTYKQGQVRILSNQHELMKYEGECKTQVEMRKIESRELTKQMENQLEAAKIMAKVEERRIKHNTEVELERLSNNTVARRDHRREIENCLQQ